ncbi:MAG TPA: hypothetical protein VMB77_05660 [Syntrophales bacterium]|nr:hypothetical protein [Syntrophales bacterium]
MANILQISGRNKISLMGSFMRFGLLKKIVFSACLFALLALLPPNAAPAKESPIAKPVPVTVGVYLTDIYDVDVKKGTYNADFYIWFSWSGKVNPRNFEVVNGHLTFKHEESAARTAGLEYVAYRCRAVLHGSFDLSDYPWDKQTLSIQIEDEDLDTQNLIYIADQKNSKVNPGLNIGHRSIGNLRISTLDFLYDTNFGHPERLEQDGVRYSRFIVELPADHKGARIFVKTFLALLVSVALAFLTFLIRPNDLPPRFSMGISGMFGAVASLVVISNVLDDCPFLTFAEKIHYVGMIFIFLSVLESSISLKLYHAGKETAWKVLDVLSTFLFPLGFLLLLMLFVPS